MQGHRSLEGQVTKLPRAFMGFGKHRRVSARVEAQQHSMRTGEMPNHDLHKGLQALISSLLNPVD